MIMTFCRRSVAWESSRFFVLVRDRTAVLSHDGSVVQAAFGTGLGRDAQGAEGGVWLCAVGADGDDDGAADGSSSIKRRSTEPDRAEGLSGRGTPSKMEDTCL